MLDHWHLATSLGIEFLVTEEFGIAAELGFRFTMNDFEAGVEAAGYEDYSQLWVAALTTTSAIKLNYHF